MSVFLESLKRNGHLEGVQMTVCNVGSRKVAHHDDYGSNDWRFFAPRLSIYGFDPDVDACEAANANLLARQINWTEKHFPLALSDSMGESSLYVTKNPMCSSLYSPNEIYLERFSQLANLMNLDFTIQIETSTLDSFCKQSNIQAIDFLQIDVQGAELLVLQGATDILKQDIIAIQTEVEFSPLYQNQPLFADVDIFLRQQNFTLFDLVNCSRTRSRSPLHSLIHPGQLLWADAFYFRDLLQNPSISNWDNPDKLLKLACIADILHFPDYALEILESITIRYGHELKYNLANSIVESLSKFPEIIPESLGTLTVIQRIRDYIHGEALMLLK